ncbi:MAG TPA: hypothetical protein V6C65_28980 [Allocoleopsis sp.]
MAGLKKLLASVLMILVTGCRSTEVTPMVITTEEFKTLGIPQHQTPVDHYFNNVRNISIESTGANQTKKPTPQFTEEQAASALGFLCDGPKPKRAVTEQFKFILPRPPAGLPLSSAAEISDRFRDWMRAYSVGFFRYVAFGRVDDRFQQINPRIFPYFFLVEDEDFDSILSRFKDHRLQSTSVPYVDVIGRMMSGRETLTPILLKSSSKNPRLVATFADAETLGRGLMSPFFWLTEAIPFELPAIREHYALAVSSAEADAWKAVAEKTWQGDLKKSLSGQVDLDGPAMTHQRLMEDKDRIWVDYFLANTAVKQGATEDGQIVAFKVTLNTEPLCRMARQLHDFVSR